MDTSVVHGRTRGGMENRHVLRRLAPPQDGMVWQGRGVPGGGGGLCGEGSGKLQLEGGLLRRAARGHREGDRTQALRKT